MKLPDEASDCTMAQGNCEAPPLRPKSVSPGQAVDAQASRKEAETPGDVGQPMNVPSADEPVVYRSYSQVEDRRKSTMSANLFIALLFCLMLVGGFIAGRRDSYLYSDARAQANARSGDGPSTSPLANSSQTAASPLEPSLANAASLAPAPVAAAAEATIQRNLTTVEQAIAQMRQTDDAFSRLKTGLADLQIEEALRLRRQDRAVAITHAIAHGRLALNAGNVPAGATIQLVYVSPGQFRMGKTEPQRRESARSSASSHYDFSVPAHQVQIESGFFMGICEISTSQLLEFLASTRPQDSVAEPSIEVGGEKPACNIDWRTATLFCEWLSKLNGLTVRLPTEIEWEYAARGSAYIQQFETQQEMNVVMGGPWPTNAEYLDRSWCGCIAMNSNVQEWCIDAWDEKAYEKREKNLTDEAKSRFQYLGLIDGVSNVNSDLYVVRGSNFRDVAANRDPALRRFKPAATREETVGFRVMVELPSDLVKGGQP